MSKRQKQQQQPPPPPPRWPIGTQIQKYFAGYGDYVGEVTSYDPVGGLYHVVYLSDGDEEDLDGMEMEKYAIPLAAVAAAGAAAAAETSRGRRRSKADSYCEQDEEEEGSSKKKKARKAKKEDNDMDGEGEAAKSTRKSQAERFSPIHNPIYWTDSLATIREQYEYLDPCGMEATDDVIDHLVGEQVLKIGALLQRALAADDGDNAAVAMLGTKGAPLKLGTACSGTDAPALALTLVQEQMERFKFTNKLAYEHVFSCEKEPFKQSYLARNFDSLLYPDIVKMTTETPQPRDVYGRPQPIPAFNLFVAGTSCKNFSMLNSTKRLDIEDKGCSGETFLAAVELLYQEMPSFAIFENTCYAPWDKMQEYITGRVKLATVNDAKKAIHKTNARDNRTKELTFTLQKDGSICATYIPLQVGVQCGAPVKGFIKPGSNTVHAFKWPSKKATANSKDGPTCTLTELIKANKVDKSCDTLVFRTPCTYCTCIQKVDTKAYGLPQTRQRTYMFVWKPGVPDNHDDDLGIYWQALVKYLESPVRHSLEAFILDTDHDNIRVFREALNGPPGRHSKRSIFQELDFWTSGNANVKHNKIARKKSGIQEFSRPNVGGAARGKKQIPPHYWLEYLNCEPQRELDMLDILHISAARDAETHDSNFSSFFWNISQNVSKEKHRAATPGIAGCISPGGEFFVSNLGRPLLGCEKLLVQGIPYFRLALSSETEVELGDLAGNAMTLTVVCACMLAAVTCPQLRAEAESENIDISELHALLDRTANMQLEKTVIPTELPTFGTLSEATPVFETFAALATEAVESSVWCTCETSGRNSTSCDFMWCSTCRISFCSSCLGSHAGYQTKSHTLLQQKLVPEHHNMGQFLSKLRNVAPASLTFGKDGIGLLASMNKDVHRVAHLWKFIFNLQKIQRERRKWVLHYNARDSNGVGEVVAEFRVTIGELWTQDKNNCHEPDLGMKGELISYFPAKIAPLIPGKLEPFAVVVVEHGNASKLEWMARDKPTRVDIQVVGKEPGPSERVELGITDAAAEMLEKNTKSKQQKHFRAAKSRKEERRWVYPTNWKEWPSTISIECDEMTSVNGEYVRVSCRQTANQSAIWSREAEEEKPAMYLIIKPNIGRTGPDTAVISRSIAHTDFFAISASLPSFWNPCDALNPALQKQRCERSTWVSAPKLVCFAPNSAIQVEATSSLPSFIAVNGLSKEQISMLYPIESGDNETIDLNVHSGVVAQKVTRSFNYLCVPPIMCHVAQSSQLTRDLSPKAEWKMLEARPEGPKFGYCDKIIPRPPKEYWEYVEEREAWLRKSEPGASRKYYLELQDAKKTFEFNLNKAKGCLAINCYPEVAAHCAARYLNDGRGDVSANELVVTYRLSDMAQQSDPEYSPFKVYPCQYESATDIGLKLPYQLYERQQKVVTKMSLIESGSVDYEEIEMVEHEMPGSTGFSIIAKASRNRKILGGCIADAIGAGKTVISIAVILQGLKAARKGRALPRTSGASLVAVPSGLINQWKDEVEKFTNGLKVLCIHDTRSLAATTVQSIIEADVVIFPVDILESKGYTENLVAKSGLKAEGVQIPDLLKKNGGHVEKPGCRGVWIPNSSRDPYGIGSANEMKNQKLRDVTAYFTYSYLNSVKKLREKVFKAKDRGVPLEYFTWERVFVDEIHECLCTEKDNLQLDWFKEKNRRASRELLGITQKDVSQRPLIYRKSIFGLTGTPLLDNSNRVIELANLIGCTYIIGLASHWRKLERESRRDLFLQHYLEPKQSREIRKAIYSKAQEYLEVACCRNTTEKELEGIEKKEQVISVCMSEEEKVLYLASQHGIDRDVKGFGVRPENFDPSAGHDISRFLKQNAELPSRGKALVDTCQTILSKHPTTKIIVFTDGRIGAGHSARRFLDESGLGCTWLSVDDSVEQQNQKISFYQRPDATEEDRNRPRILVLHFDHAAGLNLQKECYNLILYSPLYVGDGGITGDPVADASTEQQAIGRVFRPGQLRAEVFVYRIECQGTKGEECLDGYLIRRNTDEQTLAATTNAGEAH